MLKKDIPFELYASKVSPLIGIGSIILLGLYDDEIRIFSLIITLLTFCSYYGVHYCLSKSLDKYPEDKNKFVQVGSKRQMYFVKNIIKSIYLGLLMIFIEKILTDTIHNTIDLQYIKRCAIIYTINDMIGLILSDLPLTTIMHHSMTSLMCHVVLLKSDSNTDYKVLIILYATFSSLAFIVNFYLGLRNIPPIKTWKHKSKLSYVSFLVYVIVVFINWSVQVYMLTQFDIPYFYYIFLFVVIRDDIILMKWLYYDSKKT